VSQSVNENQNGNGSLGRLEKQFECMLEEINHNGRETVNNDNNDDLHDGTYRVDFNDEEENEENEGESSLHLHNDKYNTEMK